MVEIPEPPMPWLGKCNLEPEWLNNMAEGMLRDQFLTQSLLIAMMPGFGILTVTGLGFGLIPRKLPFHIRVWRRVKVLFTFKEEKQSG